MTKYTMTLINYRCFYFAAPKFPIYWQVELFLACFLTPLFNEAKKSFSLSFSLLGSLSCQLKNPNNPSCNQLCKA